MSLKKKRKKEEKKKKVKRKVHLELNLSFPSSPILVRSVGLTERNQKIVVSNCSGYAFHFLLVK